MKKVLLVLFVICLSACASLDNTDYTGQITIKEITDSTNITAAASPTPAAAGSDIAETAVLAASPAQSINEYTADIEVEPISRMVKGVHPVKYTNNSADVLNSIYFNLYLNAFDVNFLVKPYFQAFEDKIFERGRDFGYIRIIKMIINKEDANYEVNGISMEVSLDEPLDPGGQIEMTLHFEAYIPLISHRTGANASAMWCGNFLPVIAVYDDKGWHTDKYYPAGDPFFSDISNYTVNITTPADYVVVGTGLEKTTEKDNKKITSITASMVRDFAFAISSKYSVKTVTTSQGVDVNIYYYSDIADLYYYLVWAQKSIDYYSELIGSYPYPTLDIVECEMFFECGMEYPQIVFMDSNYLKKQSSYKTIVHEITHQWFYNIIGSDQVNEAWLDEGFAAFLQDMYIYGDDLNTRMREEYNNLKQNIGKIGNPRLSGNLSVYEKWNDYYNIQYVRAKLMLYSLNKKMGDEMFTEFLKVYYNTYCFRTADKNGLIGVAEQVYGESLAEFFAVWINEKELPPLEGERYK